MYIQLVVYIQTMILYFQNMFHRQSDTVYWQWAQQTETQGNSIKKKKKYYNTQRNEVLAHGILLN